MTKIMIPTEMTDGQIESAVDKFRAAMRKHRHKIPSDVAQRVLGIENLGMIMFTLFRELAEEVSNLIICKATVNRSRSQQEAIEATGRRQYTDREVVNSMPTCEGEEVEVVFFKPDLSGRNSFISEDDLEKEFVLRGLEPADPISVAAVNEADPAFADKNPHGTHWKDAKGNWCCANFSRLDDRRKVGVGRSAYGWSDHWWFAGVRRTRPL